MIQTSTAATTTTSESYSLSERVIEEVADAAGVSKLDLDPLYETVDPDALDALFRQGATGSITFVYHGHEVVVRGDGDVRVS